MNADFVKFLNCPARDCGSRDLSLQIDSAEEINYRTGKIEEVREGAINCSSCGRSYPIREFVPSFEQLFPEELVEEAKYWDDWYGFFWDIGYRGFFDLRTPLPLFIERGIEIPDPLAPEGKDRPGTHSMLADEPQVQAAERLLDVGCGCGWSSLYLARRDHKVVAFDPSGENIRRAKQYAISQGEYIEYLVAGLGFLAFEPEVFDGVFALHSIHHVPDLRNELAILRRWLKKDAVVAVDEHIQSDPTLLALGGQIEKWFQNEVAPRHITLATEALAALPRAGHSKMEDAGSEELVSALAGNFSIESFSARYVALDRFSFMYYLARDCDPHAYTHASEIIDHIYRFFGGAFPEQAEYVTLLGRNTGKPGPATPELGRLIDTVAVSGKRRVTPTELLLEKNIDSLLEAIDIKNKHIANLESVIAGQEKELAVKQVALDSQTELLKSIESGRVMKLLNRLTGK